MLSRRTLKLALRGIARSKDMLAARLAYDHAYDAGLGGTALYEKSDGGGSDSGLDILCVTMSCVYAAS
jgi:hypothetical protein